MLKKETRRHIARETKILLLKHLRSQEIMSGIN